MENISLILLTIHSLGLISSGYIVDSLDKAKKTIMYITIICALGTLVFFLPYSSLWNISLIIMSFSAGIYIGSWGFYLKNFTTQDNRVETIAKLLILSNVFMLIINVVAINISLYFALSITIALLIISFFLVFNISKSSILEKEKQTMVKVIDISKPIALLWIFIAIITITSGLMYSVVTPAFSHHTVLTSWYWAIPYIDTFLLMKSSDKLDKAHILNIAIAMIGVSFYYLLY